MQRMCGSAPMLQRSLAASQMLLPVQQRNFGANENQC